MNDNEFLHKMSKLDQIMDHDPETCGNCYYQYIMSEIAREMLGKSEGMDDEVSILVWADELDKRWKDSKFYKLYKKCQEDGLDVDKEFASRGWEQ